jgi:cysteine-rich repeat protein
MKPWIPLSLCLTLALAGGPAFAARSLAVTELASTVTCYNGDNDRVYANATPYNPSSIRCRDFASGNDWNAFAVSRTTVSDPYYPVVRMYVNAALLADDNGEGAGEFQAGHFDYTYRLDVTALPEESWRLSGTVWLTATVGFWNETGGSSAQHGGTGSPTDMRVLVDGVELARLGDHDADVFNVNIAALAYDYDGFWGPTYSGSRSLTVRVMGSLEAYSTGDEVAVMLGIDDLSNGLDTADDYDTWNRDPDDDELYVGIGVSTVPVCGNGHVEDGYHASEDWTQVTEACDDGNLLAGDGCSATCEIEPCADGADDDGDGLADFPDDPGCVDAVDLDEHDPTLPCDDGADGDGDGRADYSANSALSDPGCKNPTSTTESPQCQDGKNNDNQPGIDFDGGASLDLNPQDGFIDVEFNPSTPAVGSPDPQCNLASKNRELASCGIGFELALLLPALDALRRRARRREGGRAR